MAAILQHWQVSGSGKAVNLLSVEAKSRTSKSGYEWIRLDANDPEARQWLVDDPEDIGDEDIEKLDRMVLATLRRDVISLRRYLAPQRDALNSFTVQGVKWITG